jgi:ribosome maturation factor RimP
MARQTQLSALVEPAVSGLGFELWGIEYLPQRNHAMLRIYIDGPNGITVDDCALVSRQVSAVLDVEDPIQSEYTLEVSSPGLDRPLFKLDQYARYAGEKVMIRLRVPFERRRNFSGTLIGVEGEDVVVHVDDHEYLLPFETIDKAHIVGRIT